MYICKNEGIASLWRGLIPALMMALPSTILYFLGYEYLKGAFFWNLLIADCDSSDMPEDKVHPMSALLSGASARSNKLYI